MVWAIFHLLPINLKFEWAILSQFNIAISVVNGPFFCWMGLWPSYNTVYVTMYLPNKGSREDLTHDTLRTISAFVQCLSKKIIEYGSMGMLDIFILPSVWKIVYMCKLSNERLFQYAVLLLLIKVCLLSDGR